MQNRLFARATVFLAMLTLLASANLGAEEERSSTTMQSAAAACFAPNTPSRYVEEVSRNLADVPISLAFPDTQNFEYTDGDRWSRTATGGGLGEGDPTTLTWGIVPDGTDIDDFGVPGEVRAPSNLEARLDVIYGNRATWFPHFQRVFDRWSELTGITYVYQAADDGAAMTRSLLPRGALGVRPDIRIGGHRLDGNNGVLAYNFFPDLGDMVIDTGDSFFTNLGNDSRGLRNVLAHEHGHGIGLQHVCPVSQTKLMEPFVSSRFDGPQHDDILASNRAYGDTNEHNDIGGTATDTGPYSPGGGYAATNLSVDDNADVDYMTVDVQNPLNLTVTVAPFGSTYRSGPQLSGGSCSSGTNFDSLRIHDLSLELLDTDGTTVLELADIGGRGDSETIQDFTLRTPGIYFVRIAGDSTNTAQLFDISIDATDPTILVDPTVFESISPLDVTAPANAIGTVAGTSIDVDPAPGSLQYYQIDDGNGTPAIIFAIDLMPTDPQIRLSF